MSSAHPSPALTPALALTRRARSTRPESPLDLPSISTRSPLDLPSISPESPNQAREINLQLSGIGAAPQLLWLTLSALRCPLPPLWQQTGPTLFVHLTTGEHRQNHPLTPVFRETARLRTLTLPPALTLSPSPSPNQVRKPTLTLTPRILAPTLTLTLTLTLPRCAS